MPRDARARHAFHALVACCVAALAMLVVSALGLPPGTIENQALAVLAAGAMLVTVVNVLLASATPRAWASVGALVQDDDGALSTVTDLGPDPLAIGIPMYLVGLVALAAGAASFVNGAHVADAILASAIGHAVVTALAVRALGPTAVRVGRDGIVLARGGSERRLSWTELRDVRERPRRIDLLRLDGRQTSLPVARLPASARATLVARIRHGLASVSEPLPERAALLERAGRSFADWRRAVAALVERDDYRTRGLSREELETVLAASRCSVERRVGAALALASSGARAADRVREVARACPDRRVHAVLLASLDAAGAAAEASDDETDEAERTIARARRA